MIVTVAAVVDVVAVAVVVVVVEVVDDCCRKFKIKSTTPKQTHRFRLWFCRWYWD